MLAPRRSKNGTPTTRGLLPCSSRTTVGAMAEVAEGEHDFSAVARLISYAAAADRKCNNWGK